MVTIYRYLLIRRSGVKLYWIAAYYEPKKVEKEDPATAEKPVIVLKPEVILAETDAIATMKATRLVPSEYEDRLEQITVAVRPF